MPPFQESQHYLQVQACTGFREFLPHLTHHGESKARMETGTLALHPFFNHLIMLSSKTVSLHCRPLMRTFLFFQEGKMKLRTGKERAGNCKLPQWVLKLSFQAISICQQPLLFCKDSFSVAHTITAGCRTMGRTLASCTTGSITVMHRNK